MKSAELSRRRHGRSGMTAPDEVCERPGLAVEERVGACARQCASGAMIARTRHHLDLERAAGPRERRRVDTARQQPETMSCILGTHPQDLTAQVRLERAQMR